jgi:TolA-binding protein
MPGLGEFSVMGGLSVKRIALVSIGLLLCLQPIAGAQELGKAWELLAKGEREQASQIATTVLANPQNQKAKGEAFLVQALCEENGERALNELNQFVSSFPGHPLRWRAEMELGLHYYALGTYRGAVKHFEKVREVKPPKREQVRAAYWLGLALEGAGDFAKAKQHFEAVKVGDAGTGLAEVAGLGLADCLKAQGDYSMALSEYMRVVTTYGRGNWLPCALYGAGVCLERLGRQSEANQIYARLGREFPGSFEATIVGEQTKGPTREKVVTTEATSYRVQLGAFSQETNASALVALLKDEGVADAGIVQEERGGRVLYIVGVGGFPSKEAAQRKGKELSARLGLSYSIVAK